MSTSGTAAKAAQHREWDLTVRGTRVRMQAAGSGDPLLYLHGSGDPGLWTPALTALAETHRVYRPDHPGFNGSADRDGIAGIHDLAFFYLDVLDAIEAEQVVVVGSSLGGWIAADLATIEPRRVSRLVLVAAAGLRAPEVREASGGDRSTRGPAEAAELLYHDAELRAAAVRQAAAIENDPPAFERFQRNRKATAHLTRNAQTNDPKLSDRLHRVTAPTLILWGEHDALLPVGNARRWAELLPGAEVEILADAGHLPLVERTDAALAVLRAFLGRGSASRAAAGTD